MHIKNLPSDLSKAEEIPTHSQFPQLIESENHKTEAQRHEDKLHRNRTRLKEILKRRNIDDNNHDTKRTTLSGKDPKIEFSAFPRRLLKERLLMRPRRNEITKYL